MPPERGPFPEFSWSERRRSTLLECPRKYYYQYYGFWNGRQKNADPIARAAFRLMHVTNLHSLVGKIVRDLAGRAIARVRDGGVPYRLDELVGMGRRELNLAYRQSQKRADWERNPESLTMLRECYYGPGPSNDLVGWIKRKLVSSLSNLCEASSYSEALWARFVEVKEADRTAYFLLDGYRIYAQPDLFYRRESGEYRLVDWKTGEESDLDSRQFGTYALYVRSRGNLQAAPTTGCLEYLLSGSNRVCPITEAHADEGARAIRRSITVMQGYLADAEANEALRKEAFPICSDTSACRYCRFFELDKEEISGTPSQGPI